MARGAKATSIIPPHHHLMWPTLKALKALGNSGSNQEISDLAAELAGFSEEQLQVPHGDGPLTEVNYRLHWARSYLKSVGAVTNTSRGVWAITELGLTLTEADMAGIPAQVRATLSNKPGRKQSGGKVLIPAPESQPEDRNSNLEAGEFLGSGSFTVADSEAWRESLLETLLAMPPASFEKLCQRLLREEGFTTVEVTGRTGDGGIDGIGVLRVSLLSFQVLFQCKRYSGRVGSSAVRDFRGAMVGRTDKGLIITTGTFTADAKREATRDGAPPLDLLDGEALCMLLKKHSLGVTTEMVEAVKIDPSFFQAL